MSSLVRPRTYLIGITALAHNGLEAYLRDTGQEAFLGDVQDARAAGVAEGEILCSFFAKLCYASLVMGKNDNLTQTRSIKDNVLATLAAGHGSVFEHVTLNFVTTACSRVFTHEIVRHRTGTAFSQTSGRYVRTDELVMVWDPILDPIKEMCEGRMQADEAWYMAARVLMGLGTAEEAMWMVENAKDPLGTAATLRERGYTQKADHPILPPAMSFDRKKKITSALRRFLPNGQANEMGWSVNLRQLRHMIMLRTSRGAEWEIRLVFNDVFEIVRRMYPLMFEGAASEHVDGLLEVTGLKLQPYDQITT